MRPILFILIIWTQQSKQFIISIVLAVSKATACHKFTINPTKDEELVRTLSFKYKYLLNVTNFKLLYFSLNNVMLSFFVDKMSTKVNNQYGKGIECIQAVFYEKVHKI